MNGETIKLIDSSNARYRNFIIEGNSIQDGEPTPETPVEIESVESVEVGQCSENLYNYKDENTIGDEFSSDDDGWITISVDNSEGTTVKYLNYYTNNLPIKENTPYNIFMEVKEVSGNGAIIVSSTHVDTTGQEAGQFIANNANYKFSDLSNGDVKQNIAKSKADFTNIVFGIRTFVQFTAGQSGSITFRLSVLEDTSITPDTFIYKPYKGSTATIPLLEPLRSLPNGIKDTIEKDGIHRKVGVIIFDGSDDEYWAISNNCYYANVPNKARRYDITKGAVLSTHFKETPKGLVANVSTNEFMEGYYSDGNQNIFLNYDNVAGGVDNFKDWLQENPVTVQYELAKEVIEPFTEEQQKAYDNIINNGTYKTTTNIYSSNEVSPTFKVEYSKDLETIINNLG